MTMCFTSYFRKVLSWIVTGVIPFTPVSTYDEFLLSVEFRIFTGIGHCIFKVKILKYDSLNDH